MNASPLELKAVDFGFLHAEPPTIRFLETVVVDTDGEDEPKVRTTRSKLGLAGSIVSA